MRIMRIVKEQSGLGALLLVAILLVPLGGSTRAAGANVMLPMVVRGIGSDLAGSSPEQAGFCDSVTEIPRIECEALVALYDSTGGTLARRGWLATNSPCSWYGMTCSSGRVSALVCRGELRGSIPHELSNLSYLEILNLAGPGYDGGGLYGNIPSELGGLARLEVLNLSSNDLVGPIPPELGNLARLNAVSHHKP